MPVLVKVISGPAKRRIARDFRPEWGVEPIIAVGRNQNKTELYAPLSCSGDIEDTN